MRCAGSEIGKNGSEERFPYVMVTYDEVVHTLSIDMVGVYRAVPYGSDNMTRWNGRDKEGGRRDRVGAGAGA